MKEKFLELKACIERHDFTPFYTGSYSGIQNIKFLMSTIEEQQQEIEKLTRLAIEAYEGHEYWKEKFQQAQQEIENLRLEVGIFQNVASKLAKDLGTSLEKVVSELAERALEGES
jgi:antitoxin component HigA of HigAB toxin-antitoxin module